MLESEQAVHERANSYEEIPQRVCSQLLGHQPRYAEWHSRHELRMKDVADARRRDPQVLKLRTIALQQVHRTAVVNYLHQGRIVGEARDQTLALFHGVNDSRGAALAEHRHYLLAASTQFCTHDLLDLVGDRDGLALIRSYELAYGQYFALFCDRARARQVGAPYLLSSLVPEVKAVADRLRLRILGTQLVAPEPRRTPPAAVARSASPARRPAQARELRDPARAGPQSVGPQASLRARSRTAY
jgi:hypothetical protein